MWPCWLPYGLSISILVVVGYASAEESPVVNTTAEALAVTSLTIQVTLPDGSPAAGIPIDEFGLERYTIYNKEIGPTGPDGTVRVEFQPGRHPDATVPLGYGVFRFLLKPDSFRWELSDIYCWAEFDRSRDVQGGLENSGDFPDYEKWFEPGNDGTWPDREPSSNWSYGRGVPVRGDTPLVWTVRLQPGELRELTVVDQYEKPIDGADISVVVDLRAHSHTGGGAEVFMGRMHTDSLGRFALRHVSDFAYQFSVRGNGWLYDPNDTACLDPRLNQNLRVQGNTLRFQRPVEQDLLFVARCAGNGAPAPDVAIYGCIQFPSACEAGAPLGKTGPDGMFRFVGAFPLEHCTCFVFRKSGYLDGRYFMKDHIPGQPIVVELELPAALDGPLVRPKRQF
jgi:hypothetical protein